MFRLYTLIAMLCLTGPFSSAQERQPASAWEALLVENPGAADDVSIGWRERLILHALTPEQARSYYRGSDLRDLVLESGQTLEDYLQERLLPLGNLFIPLLSHCDLFDSGLLEVGPEDRPQKFGTSAESFLGQDEKQGECGLPEDVTALLLQIEFESAADEVPRIKLWPADLPEPAEAVLQGSGGWSEATRATVITSLSPDGEFRVRSSAPARIRGTVTGYFRPPRATDQLERLPLAGSADNTWYGGNNPLGANTGENNSAFGWAALQQNTSGNHNTGVGAWALTDNTTGSYNSALGQGALTNNLKGSYNVAIGNGSLFNNTSVETTPDTWYSGNENTAVGYRALYSNQTGSWNTAVGMKAGYNTLGSSNTFLGREAGFHNTLGVNNTYLGDQAGYGAATGSEGMNNTGVGRAALTSNQGASNTAVGAAALQNNDDGSGNTAVGYQALSSNTTEEDGGVFYSGIRNTAVGENALYNNTTGQDNTAVGAGALENAVDAHGNTAVGYRALWSSTSSGYDAGKDNTAIGRNALEANLIGSGNTAAGAWAGLDATGGRNSFFGASAGQGTTSGLDNTGYDNSFFGFESGKRNTSGSSNSFFGADAGSENTQGSFNAFFGASAGDSNTVETRNTFLGAYADLDSNASSANSPVTNATAVGHQAFVSQSNSLVLGSIAGVNSATDSVSVGIGTTAPLVPLHVKRTDGKAKVLVEEAGSPANRIVMELKNNGSTFLKFTNTFNGTSWTLNPLGTSFTFDALNYPGQELRLYDSGRLVITPSSLGSASFDLAATGDLFIAGGLTAGGMFYPSDRNQKQNIRDVDLDEVLEKVASMQVSRWNYRQGDPSEHIGPMAQDFYALFGVGKDDKHLSPTDTAGVALAAIQGLHRELQEKDARIARLEAELAEIRSMLSNR